MSGAYLIAFVANFLAPQGSLVSHLIIPCNNAPSVFPPWVQEYIFIWVPNSGVLQPQPFWGLFDWLPALLPVPHRGGFPQHLLILFHHILSHLDKEVMGKDCCFRKNLSDFLGNGFVAPVHLSALQRCQKEIRERCWAPSHKPAVRARLEGWMWKGDEKARW